MHLFQALPNRARFDANVAERLAEALQHALETRGSACAALSGGTTPGGAYALLARRPIDWKRVTLALVDERFVAPDQAGSNEALIRRTLGPALAAGATLTPMFGPGTLEEAAAAANAAYAPIHIDIALMGMGADAHTASWFPGSADLARALDPNNTDTVMAVRAPQADAAAERLTLTYAAIARADHVLLAFTGVDKFAAFGGAQSSGPLAAPVAALFDLGEKFETVWTL